MPSNLCTSLERESDAALRQRTISSNCGCIYGQIVCDASGVSCEFRICDTLRCGGHGGALLSQPVYQRLNDNTSIALVTCDGICAASYINVRDMRGRYVHLCCERA